MCHLMSAETSNDWFLLTVELLHLQQRWAKDCLLTWSTSQLILTRNKIWWVNTVTVTVSVSYGADWGIFLDSPFIRTSETIEKIWLLLIYTVVRINSFDMPKYHDPEQQKAMMQKGCASQKLSFNVQWHQFLTLPLYYVWILAMTSMLWVKMNSI